MSQVAVSALQQIVQSFAALVKQIVALMAVFPVIVPPCNVSALPLASHVGAGARGFALDSTQTLAAGIGTAVVGGGANKTPVWSDGTIWRIG